MQSVTMNDVAEIAGVSPSTVSLYLRRPEAVSERASRKIASAVDRLGYVPSLMAGGLASAGSRVVSIIVPSLRNAFFAETVSTMQGLLREVGLQTLIGHTEYSLDQEAALVRTALSWAPAGIVLTGLEHSEDTRRLLKKAAVPVVEMWELGSDPIDLSVGFSHLDVGRAGARHLIACGRRRPIFLGARMQDDRRALQRSKGFVAELSDRGMGAPIVIHAGPASTEAGAILLQKAFAQETDFDAIACSNDAIALGVLFECQRRGIEIPKELAVIGFGDLEFASFCVPSLTTIRPSGNLIAREVVRLLIERIDNTDEFAERQPCEFDTSFAVIQRGST